MSSDFSIVAISFVFRNIGELFVETICFLGVRVGYFIVIERDGLVGGRGLFFVC